MRRDSVDGSIFCGQKNLGNPGVPGNMGVNFSHGEYLLVLDNDDAITPDAIEKLYSAAKKFDADVVACEKYYSIPNQDFYNAETLAKIQPYSYQRGGFVNEPTLITDNFALRVQDCFQHRFMWNIWSKLIRRDFVIENELRFTDNFIQDMIFTCCLVFSAERFVRVPYVVNRYRVLEDSLSHRSDSLEIQIDRYLRALKTGFEYVDKFLDDRPFFRQRPDIKYFALNFLLCGCFECFMRVYGKIPVPVLENVLRQKLAHENFSSALTAVILNNANIFNLQLKIAKQRIAALENEIRRLKGQA